MRWRSISVLTISDCFTVIKRRIHHQQESSFNTGTRKNSGHRRAGILRSGMRTGVSGRDGEITCTYCISTPIPSLLAAIRQRTEKLDAQGQYGQMTSLPRRTGSRSGSGTCLLWEAVDPPARSARITAAPSPLWLPAACRNSQSGGSNSGSCINGLRPDIPNRTAAT